MNKDEKIDKRIPHQRVLQARQQFGKRLYSEMTKRGWTQADLSRFSGMTPDRISRYVNGGILPTQRALEQLAKTFQIEASSLLDPGDAAGSPIEINVGVENPGPLDTVSITSPAGRPGRAILYVNKEVSFKTALKVAELLDAETDSAAD